MDRKIYNKILLLFFEQIENKSVFLLNINLLSDGNIFPIRMIAFI